MRRLAEAGTLWGEAQHRACDEVERRIDAEGMELVRFAYADLHGVLRGKALTAPAAKAALRDGLRMVGTLLLKDSAHRTVYPVFSGGTSPADALFAGASDVCMLPDPTTFRVLPWTDRTGWVLCEPCHADGRPVPLDPRYQARRALQRLAQAGHGLTTGLEVEFHVYRITSDPLDPARADWPGEPPEVAMVHPGYNVLTEQWLDMAEEPLRVVRETARALDLPLTSVEVELGPSQLEVVMSPADALTSADRMVLLRSAVKQALRRAGYHATFMCRPPFEHVVSSGWHLHQSLVDAASGRNLFTPDTAEADPMRAGSVLSPQGVHYLGGLLAHARGNAFFAVPTLNGYGRYQPNMMAPQRALWGRDNRGAMLRVIGAGAADPAARIENRAGEPLANPYLYMASQVHAGLDGMARALDPGPAADAPYEADAPPLPVSLDEALDALEQDTVLVAAFGADFIAHCVRVKRAELARAAAAPSRSEWERREYFRLY